MTRTCPSCGSAAAPEARYCRRCGTPLQRAAGAETDANFVSPLAATVPLSEEGRTTNGLAQDELGRPNAETNRVKRGELEELLRTVKQDHALDERTPNEAARNEPSPTHGAQATRHAAPPDPVSVTRPALNFPHAPDGDGETSTAEELDDELTITVTRPGTVTQPDAPPRQVVPLEETEVAPPPPPETGAEAEDEELAAYPSPPRTPAVRPRSHKVWYVVAAASLVLLLGTALAAWFGVGVFRPSRPAGTSGVAVAPPPDPKQLFEEKLTEAEALLAGGDLDAAIARLREATTLDPSNTRAHRRLGDLLLDNGRRREAIEEYRAIIRRDPRDGEAWRSLARAQLDESLFADAAESYRQLVALGGDAALNDNERLSYAEALRLSGRARDAQPLYQKLLASPVADVATTARQRLEELSSAVAAQTPQADPQEAHNAHEQLNQNRAPQTQQTPALPTPTPALPPALPTPAPSAPPQSQASLSAGEHFKRGEQLWWSNRPAALEEFRAATAKGNKDAYYYLGLSIVEGKDPRTLNRALLGAAFQYFQNAERGGKFRGEAKRYEQTLGEEIDRRRRQNQ